jgi:uncharacterized protein (DUF305 family)
MRFSGIFICLLTIIIVTGCSPTQRIVENSPEPIKKEETIAQNSRENNKELEDLFWARRDSTTLNFTDADVEFMSGMIGHHSQALIMSSLAEHNNASKSVQILAARIINAQKDEIAIMQRWLSDRNQSVPQVKIEGLNLILTPGNEPELIFSRKSVIEGLVNSEETEHHSMHGMEKEEAHDTEHSMHSEMDAMLKNNSNMSHMANNGVTKEEEQMHLHHNEMVGHMHDHSGMPGMLTQSQLEELSRAKGIEFDKLFLRYMIQHHAGAITMVNDLVKVDGAAQEVSIGKLAGDINVDQKTEIERMRLMLLQIMEKEISK